MARVLPLDDIIDDHPVPATQPAIQQLAGLLVRDTRYLTAGYRLFSDAVSRIRCRRWPSDISAGYIFVPTLRLATSGARLKRYARHVPKLISTAGQEAEGCWLPLSDNHGAAPSSETLDLPERYRPDIGPVDVDQYVRYLAIYRRIVESNTCAVTKIVAINALGERAPHAEFAARHCHIHALFPLSRFQLTIDLLPGVGQKTRQLLAAYDLASIPAVATADRDQLAHVLNNRQTDAERIKRAAETLTRRACVATRGERLGPAVG